MVVKLCGRTVQYLITSAVSLAAMTAGVSVYWSVPMMPKFHNHETDIEITDEEASWIVAFLSPGYVLGSLVCSLIIDRFGRRASILGCAIPTAIGMASFIYLAEIADKDIRGKLSVALTFSTNFGSFLVLSVGSVVSYSTLNRMLIVLPVAHFIACWFIPETPNFYMKDNKVEAAAKSLNILRDFKDENELYNDLESLRSNVNKETRRPATLKELFTGKQYRRALVIATGIKLTHVMSGSLAVQQYSGIILHTSLPTFPLSAALMSVGATRFLSGIVSSILVDKLGRRPLLIVTYIGTGIVFGIVAIYFYFQEVVGIDLDSSLSSAFRYVPFVGVLLIIGISTIGYESLAFIIPAELFPINVKSIALTYLNIFAGFMNFVVVKGFKHLRDWTGFYGVFCFFAIFSVLGGLFSYFYALETKGKSLREILVKLQGNFYEETEELDKLNVVTNDM